MTLWYEKQIYLALNFDDLINNTKASTTHRDVLRQFLMGGRGVLRKWQTKLFLISDLYISNLFNSAWYKDSAQEEIYSEIHY